MRIGEAVRLWIVCWVGNLVGSIILALLFTGAGFAEGPVGQFIAGGALAKMTLPVLPLFLRGVLCNILVCLAVWCGFRCKTESGKLIMIFWCLFAFITCGFEHSVANMTLLTISLLSPCGTAVTLGGYFYNLLVVTLGNMTGAILFPGNSLFHDGKEKRCNYGIQVIKEAFDACLAKLSQDCDVYAPVRMAGGNPFSDTDCIRYGKIKSIEEVVFDEKSDYSYKEILLPLSETLFYFTEKEVKEADPKEKGGVIFLRSYDLHAVKRMDDIYLYNGFEDYYYKRLRERVKFVLMGCKASL